MNFDRSRPVSSLALVCAGLMLLSGCGGGVSNAKVAPYRQANATGGSAQAPPADVDHDMVREEAAPAAAFADKKVMAAPGAPPPPPPPPQPQGGEKTKADSAVAQGEEKRDTQLIIYTAKVTMAVYQVETGLASVEKIAKDMGGYLSLKKDREIVIRVPRARFEPSLAAIDKVGDVLHRDIQAQDVTDEFVDVEIRIKNARAMQARLKTLLERAAVKEALEIEKEMNRVTQELELLEGKLKLLKDKIAYSTITVHFEARGSTIQATRVRLPFPWLTQLGLPSLLSLSEVKQ